ncbi:hypothetical protein ACH4VR_04600 [Streptomyces sp. NPDC020883]|uniref:hypothetical protein n=1 Tax=Streptomyces sp. NPDC020883 TaxID=3365099 RepID=UPI0037B3600B
MRFLPRSLRKQTRHPGSGTTTSRSRALVTLHVRCDRHAENKVRALCVLALSQPGARLEALRSAPYDSVTAHLHLTATLDVTETGLLDRLVDMLSRVPSVRDLHWQRDDGADGRASVPGRGSAGATAH